MEHACSTVEDLAAAYRLVLDTVGTNIIDLDIEASVNIDLMNGALALLQTQRPDISVSFTLMVQGEDYGLTPGALGVQLLENARDHGVKVDMVNAMAMEYPKISEDFGESVINVGINVINQLREIWPEKNESELHAMLGLTPMLGRNFNANVFQPQHARTVVNWAKANQIGLLAFWSIERDNGGCIGVVSPTCSGTEQDDYEFTAIFRDLNQ